MFHDVDSRPSIRNIRGAKPAGAFPEGLPNQPGEPAIGQDLATGLGNGRREYALHAMAHLR